MNSTTRFLHKSTRLGLPIAGITVHVHRTCWPLLAVLMLAPHRGAVFLLAVAGSLFLQVAAYGVMVRCLGGTPQDAIIFPFGPVFTGGTVSGATDHHWLELLAGPVGCLILSTLLETIPQAFPWAQVGRLSRDWALLGLVPCYPLAGGVILREVLKQRGASQATANSKALEVSRVCAVVIGFLALLALNLALIYAVLVLWVVSHLSLLVPPASFQSVMVCSRAWLNNVCFRARRLLNRRVPLLVLLILPGIGVAAGSSTTPASDSQMSGSLMPPLAAPAVDADRLAQLEARLAKLETSLLLLDALARRTADDLAELKRRAGKSQREWVVQIAGLSMAEQQLLAEQEVIRSRMGRIAADSAGLTRHTELLEQASQSLEQRDALLESKVAQALASGVARERQMMHLLIPAAAVALVFLAWFVVYYEHRLQRLESRWNNVGKTPPAQTDQAASVRQCGGDPEIVTAARSATGGGPVIPTNAVREHQPRHIHAEKPIPEPDQLLRRLIRAFTKSRRFKAKPCLPAEAPWNIGMASVKGPVRDHNEDYALAFVIGGHQVVLVADGVGGLPLGQRAGYLAVRAAALYIIKQFQWAPLGQERSPEVLTVGALSSAAARLASAAQRSDDSRGGLRTTLIVVVASPRTIAYSYIGDGAGCLVRDSGHVEQFLVPQKIDPDVPNVLAASLGPTTQGTPVAGSLPRLPGDLLICGTDGVFDRLNDDYPQRFRQAAVRLQGNLKGVADQIVQEMSTAQDELGFIGDDNLTIALVGNDVLPLAGGEETVTGSLSAEPPTQHRPPTGARILSWFRKVFFLVNRRWSFQRASPLRLALMPRIESGQDLHRCSPNIDRDRTGDGERL